MSQTDLILGSVIAAVDAVGRGQWDWCTASSTPRSTTGCCSGRTASAVRRGPGAAVLGLVALVGCWWAEQHGQDQVSVAFGLIGGTLLAAAGYAWTGRQ